VQNYTGPFTVSQTSTVKFRSSDGAGNVEATNSQAITVSVDATAPTTTISCNGGSCAGPFSAPVSVTLAATDNSGGSGVASTHYTTDGTTPSLSSPTYAAAFTVSSNKTVKFRSWDNAGNVEATNSQDISFDTTAPTTTISCNGGSCAGPFTAPVTVTLSATDTGGSGVATTTYTTDGSDPATSLTVQNYTGPFTISQTSTVKFRSSDGAGNVEPTNSQAITLVALDSTPPTTTISCNGGSCAGTFSASVSVTLAATDDIGGSGVASTHYTTDGTTPSLSSPTYTSAFTVSSSKTVKFRSWDNAGNVEATNSQDIVVDSTAPTTTMSCNGGSCAGPFSAAVTVTLSATDSGGSGVATTTYTTDGSDPATSSTAVSYSGPFTVSQTTTVKFRSVDLAGNAEATKSQSVPFTVSPPVTTIACNGAACSGWYKAAVSVTLSATDAGGPGIASTHYTTDGTTPSLSSPTYTAAFTISTTKTVKFRSWDTAGNVEATKSQLIQIDTTKPATTINCNGGVCTGTFSGSVTVAGPIPPPARPR
jgi:hypothetical protein